MARECASPILRGDGQGRQAQETKTRDATQWNDLSREHLVGAQRDAIAALRAEWARLDSPKRLQGFAERHTKLRPLEGRQYDQLKNLPERSPTLINPNEPDPIGAMIDTTDPDLMTGSIPATEGAR